VTIEKYAVTTDKKLTRCPECDAPLTDDTPPRCPEHGTRYLTNPDDKQPENRKDEEGDGG